MFSPCTFLATYFSATLFWNLLLSYALTSPLVSLFLVLSLQLCQCFPLCRYKPGYSFCEDVHKHQLLLILSTVGNSTSRHTDACGHINKNVDAFVCHSSSMYLNSEMMNFSASLLYIFIWIKIQLPRHSNYVLKYFQPQAMVFLVISILCHR